MHGKTVIITGGNRGLGKETAKKLAKRGAKIILACRNLETTLQTKKSVNATVVIKKLDVSSLKSVRTFAEQINSSEDRLDVLFHNAGIVTDKLRTTEDDLELTMATNHFGPFLLTHLLIAEKGSETGVYLATSEDVIEVSGKYFVSCQEQTVWGSVNNEEKRKIMWEVSMRLVNLTTTDPQI